MDVLSIRDRLAAPYRGPDGLVPPWVSAILLELSPTVADNLVFALLAWCSEGCPVQRAERVCMLNRLWPGGRGQKGAMFHLFLSTVEHTKAGRRAGSKRRPIKPITIPDAWPEPKGSTDVCPHCGRGICVGCPL